MKAFILLFIILISVSLGWKLGGSKDITIPLSSNETKDKRTLDKYTIENLTNADIKPGIFEVSELLNENENYTSYLFSFEFNPNLDGKTNKITTGQLNLPSGNGPFPVVVMLRGYIDQETFKTGDGTRRVADVLSQNGYITIAPDFLGYGSSDEEAQNIFETRFQTYTLVLSLIKSLDQVDNWDKENIFLWGHSNGGQIALTILEITQEYYSTVLWAPVSKQFPYSILFYTDQSVDRGKLIRSELANFEENYNPDLYSLDLYLDSINAPIQIHQGLADDAVPVVWSDELVENLEDLEKEVTYYKYSGTDHNMVPSWETIVNRDLEFFKNNIH